MEVKLQHLISKILESSDHNNTSKDLFNTTSEVILANLCVKHKEYRRKNTQVLLHQIDLILADLRKKSPQSHLILGRSGTNSSIGGGGITYSHSNPISSISTPLAFKRKRLEADVNHHNQQQKENDEEQQRSEQLLHLNNINDPEELEYDRLATEQDILQASSTSTMLLNANLQKRYKDIQKERDMTNNSSGNPTPTKAHLIHTPDPTTTITTTSTAHGVMETSKKKKVQKKSLASKRALNHQDGTSDTSTTFVTPSSRPMERYSDLGGMSDILTQIRQLIEYPLAHPELFAHLGISPPRGVLLRGPPGCGKTHLANAIAGQLNVTYFKISAPEIVSGMSGESEMKIRQLFAAASESAPSIIFMDEIDAIAPKRNDQGNSKGMEKRIVAQLLTCMDSIAPENNKNGAPVMVLGATNRPDSIDSALRRAGRFDREIVLGVPDEIGRLGILKVMTHNMRLDGDIDLKILAKKTPGFVGADIKSLTKEAGVIAINRIFKQVLIYGVESNESITLTGRHETTPLDENSSLDENIQDDYHITEHSQVNDIHSIVPFSPEQLEPLYVTMDDFLQAIPHVQPSSKREGFATIPDVSWDNIGALQSIREELSLSVLEPITHPEKFEALGLPLPAGVLLYGPPGCGKTLLAKAIANESGANFISVKGPELLDKYVGESERAVRQVFERARSSSPCIVFFDELDSLCPKRGSDSGGGGGVTERVVNQLLTEMDGLDSRRSVFVIAATNRPELIDPAMLRPGRLDKLLYVPLPTPDDRASILTALAKKVKISSDVNLDAIARSSKAEGYSGADCAALLREAGLAVLRDDVLLERGFQSKTRVVKVDVGDDADTDGVVKTMENGVAPALEISYIHFEYAFQHVMPSVSKKDQAKYDRMRNRMARARTRGGVGDTEQTEEEDHRLILSPKGTDSHANPEISKNNADDVDPHPVVHP